MRSEQSNYLDINIYGDARDSLFTAYFNLKHRNDDYKWKTVTAGIYHSFYLLLIAGLEMGDYNNVLQGSDSEEIYILVGDEKNWKKQRRIYHNEHIGSYTIAWDVVDYKPKLKGRNDGSNKSERKKQLIDFWTALARVLDSGTPKYLYIEYFELTNKNWESLEWVYNFVNKIIMFVPSSLMQQISIFHDHLLQTLEVFEVYLVDSKYLLMNMETEEINELKNLIHETKKLILKEKNLARGE